MGTRYFCDFPNCGKQLKIGECVYVTLGRFYEDAHKGSDSGILCREHRKEIAKLMGFKK